MIKNENALMNKSKKLKYSFNSLVQKLRKCNIWLLADASKRPISPVTGKSISVNNKNEFKDFETTLKGLYKFKNSMCLGIALGKTEFGQLACVDIDNCITNGKINSEAMQGHYVL